MDAGWLILYPHISYRIDLRQGNVTVWVQKVNTLSSAVRVFTHERECLMFCNCAFISKFKSMNETVTFGKCQTVKFSMKYPFLFR